MYGYNLTAKVVNIFGMSMFAASEFYMLTKCVIF